MDAQVSSSFIYAVLAGLFAVLIFIYYQKINFPEKKRHPLYYAGVFFIVYYMYFLVRGRRWVGPPGQKIPILV